jgi:GNAT superfamily N-acetyltransferase
MVNCRCSCGRQKDIKISELYRKIVKSCGECGFQTRSHKSFWTEEQVQYIIDNYQNLKCSEMATVLDKTTRAVQHKFRLLNLTRKSNIPNRFKIGDKFGKLTVVDKAIPIILDSNGQKQKVKWQILCECNCDGNKKLYWTSLLQAGHTKSCGCLIKELSKERCKKLNTKYSTPGISSHYLYSWWNRRPKEDFCIEWQNYEVFYKDIIDLFDEKLKIVRIDILKPFSLDNIKLEKIHEKSVQEQEIRNWLKNLGFDFLTNKTILNGKHIDLYNEQLKLAIEYCGLYWHTENSPAIRDRKYHYNKYKECQKQNIQLITIFSDEWCLRNKQVRNFIKSKLGLFSKRIFARKCTVQEISVEDGANFIAEYHIQNKKISIKYYGIYFGQELIGVMSFAIHHRDGKTLILDRLAFKEDYQIIGGASKLFSSAIKWAKKENYGAIITWSDNRWSTGKVYEKLGFIQDKCLKPDYSYVLMSMPFKRKSKQSSQKKNIGCPENTTEKDYMSQLGYSRIWDCGKIRWKYTITN